MTAAVTNLVWRGTETVDAVAAAPVRCADVQLHLPANFHHAMAARFRSADAAPTGLERVAALAEPAQRTRAEVRVSRGVGIRRHGAEARLE